VIGKVTQMRLPPGTVVRLQTGGGGGYGPAEERQATDVRRDIENNYITASYARCKYPHVFDLRGTTEGLDAREPAAAPTLRTNERTTLK
jgi:N-methylhydantoinase B